MSNVLEAISKLKLKTSKNHFSNLVLYCQLTAIQAYETTLETTCKTSCAITSRLLTRGPLISTNSFKLHTKMHV